MPKHKSSPLSRYSKLFLSFFAITATEAFATKQELSLSWEGETLDATAKDMFQPTPLASSGFFQDSTQSYNQKPTRILVDYNCQHTGNCQLSELGDSMEGFVLEGLGAGYQSGHSVSGVGDVNGDGLDDFIVGVPRSPSGTSYIIFGSNETWGSEFLITFADGEHGFLFSGDGLVGHVVSDAGDVNGDGFDDIFIGAPDIRSVHVILGSNETIWGSGNLDTNFLDGTHGFTLYDGLGGAAHSLSGAGDINGDGFDDLIVGAYLGSPNSRWEVGSSYLILGKETTAWADGLMPFSTLMNGEQGIALQGESNYDQSGYSVSGAGDVNGDGFDDFLIGAWHASPNGRTQAGNTYLVFGKNETWDNGYIDLSTLMDGEQGFALQGESNYDQSGYSVSRMGDINGDGLADFMVGAPFARSNAGNSYVILGNNGTTAWGNGRVDLSTLMNGERGFVIEGSNTEHSGYSVSGAGDVNGDGLADFIIGAPFASPAGISAAGNSYLIYGSKNMSIWGSGRVDLNTLMNGERGFMLQGEAFGGGNNGRSVSGAGDVNGDGLADFVIGAPSAQPGGSSYLFFGANNATETTTPSPSPSATSTSTPSSSQTASLTITPSMSFSSSTSLSGSISPSTSTSISMSPSSIASPSISSSSSLSVSSSPSFSIMKSLSINPSSSIFASLSISATPSASLDVNHTLVASKSLSLTPTSSPVLESGTSPSQSTEVIASSSPVNEAPILVNNTLEVIFGRKMIIDSSMLAATDKETPPRNLEFMISGLAYGKFLLDERTEVTVFSQGAVQDKNIIFEPIRLADGGYKTPFYEVSVSNGIMTTEPEEATVIIRFLISSVQRLNPAIWPMLLTALHGCFQLFGLNPQEHSRKVSFGKDQSLLVRETGFFAVKPKARIQELESVVHRQYSKPGEFSNTARRLCCN